MSNFFFCFMVFLRKFDNNIFRTTYAKLKNERELIDVSFSLDNENILLHILNNMDFQVKVVITNN